MVHSPKDAFPYKGMHPTRTRDCSKWSTHQRTRSQPDGRYRYRPQGEPAHGTRSAPLRLRRPSRPGHKKWQWLNCISPTAFQYQECKRCTLNPVSCMTQLTLILLLLYLYRFRPYERALLRRHQKKPSKTTYNNNKDTID